MAVADEQSALPLPTLPPSQGWEMCSAEGVETPGPPTGGQSPRAIAAKERKEVLFSPGKELGKAFWTANCWEVPQGCEVRIIHLSETKGWIYSPAQGYPWLSGHPTPRTITPGVRLLPDPKYPPDVAGHDCKTLGWGHLV